MSIEYDINSLYMCGDCGSFVPDLEKHAPICVFAAHEPSPKQLTEADVRRIVREEIDKARAEMGRKDG